MPVRTARSALALALAVAVLAFAPGRADDELIFVDGFEFLVPSSSQVSMGLSETSREGLLLVGHEGRLDIEISESTESISLTLDQAGTATDPGAVCFRLPEPDAPCQSPLEFTTTVSDGVNAAHVQVRGQTGSSEFDDLTIELSSQGVELSELPVTVVHAIAESTDGTLVNDAPAGVGFSVQTDPAVANLAVPLQVVRATPETVTGPEPRAASAASIRILGADGNFKEGNVLITGDGGSAGGTLVAGPGGQGTISVTTDRETFFEYELTNPRIRCCQVCGTCGGCCGEMQDHGTGSVHSYSGEKMLTETDLRIPGRGFDWVFRRTYRSQAAHLRSVATGDFGVDWAFSYSDDRLIRDGNNIIHFSDGLRTDAFAATENLDVWRAPKEHYQVLRRTSTGNFEIRHRDGMVRTYAPLDHLHFPGRLLSMTDRNGNVMRFQYGPLDSGKYVLKVVVDTMGRNIVYRYYPGDDANPGRRERLKEIEDFRRDGSSSGRKLLFDYDSEGNLVFARSPTVTGTPNANDFPVGKAYQYVYTDSADADTAGLSGYARQRALHNLTQVIYPNESAADLDPTNPQTLPRNSIPRLRPFYGLDPENTAEFDRVIFYDIAGLNGNDVGAGGTIEYDYSILDPNAQGVNTPFMAVTITDRRGNETEYTWSAHETLLEKREFTREFRNNEPAAFTTQFQYNADKEMVQQSLPEGNVRDHGFDAGNSDRFQQGNRISQTRTPDARGGDQTQIATERVYEPIYNQPAAVTGPRGLDPDFDPPIADACGRTRRERYTTRYFFDYQEAPAGDVLPLLADELNTTETEVQSRLDAAGIELGLGDLNGDGDTPLRITGNVVRVVKPVVTLLEGSVQAGIEGDRCQDIVTRYRYNRFGQKTAEVDPEGNVHRYEYFPEEDPDGDGNLSPKPSDDRILASDTGGYRKAAIRDTESDPDRNNGTDPAPTEIRMSYTYDDVGNKTSVSDGRGITTTYVVNELNQVVQKRRATTVPAAGTGDPPEPVALTAFAYFENTFYDFNDNVTRRDVENRGDTSNTGGVITTTYRYDMLDNRIRKTEEVDVDETLITRYRYDLNENRTLVVKPEGNATTYRYDERDLNFQTTRGARNATAETISPPPEPYNPRGGMASTMTYNYDANENLVESVDAADTDGSSDNNSTIAGAGDVILRAYDGYDRPVLTVDAVGNETLVHYDPASNVVKTIRRGPIGGPSPTDNAGTDNVELARTETTYDELNRTIQTDRVLFVSTGVTTERTPDIDDGPLTPDDGRVSQRYEYDRKSRRTVHVEDDGDTHRRFYDGADRVIRTRDPEGNTVERAYDDADNVIETRETDVAQIAGVVDEVFLTTRFYDSLDRLKRSVDNIGQASFYRYDSRDNLVAEADAVGPMTGASITRRVFTKGADTANTINDPGNVTWYYYDGFDRKIREDRILITDGEGTGDIGVFETGVKDPDALSEDFGQGSGDGRISVVYDWDQNSLLVALWDDNANRTDYSFDNLDRRVSTTKGTCDSAGRQAAVDATEPTLAGVSADQCDTSTTESVQYDPDDNVQGYTDENGSQRDCDYDAIDRRIGCNINRAPGVIGTTEQTFEYDGLSRLTRASDDNLPGDSSDDSVITYAWDSLNRVIEETQKIGGLPAKVVSSAWRAENLRTSSIYPNGRNVDSTYDGLDRLDTIADSGAAEPIADYDYIGRNRVLERRYPGNGTRLSYLNDAGDTDVGYDGLRRPVRLRHLRADDSLVVGFTHRYDRANNKLTEKHLHDTADSELYAYDSAYRIDDFQRGELAADQDAIVTPSADSLQRQEWFLDGPGNWSEHDLTEGGVTETIIRDHSSFNEIAVDDSAGDGINRAHDNNGNLADEDEFDFEMDEETHRFEWDHFNRLHRVIRNSDDAVVAVYSYHADGRRSRKVVTNSGGLNGTTDFYYSGWQVLEERDSGDAITEQYVYGVYIDEPLVMDRDENGNGSVVDSSDTRRFYHQNTLFSSSALTDRGANVEEAYQYDAFGSPAVYGPGSNGVVDFGGDDVVSESTDIGNPYLFTGRRFDSGVGHYYARNRYLSPRMGRFLSRDPLSQTHKQNAYAYVDDRPTRYVDPLGLECLAANEAFAEYRERLRGGLASGTSTTTFDYNVWHRLDTIFAQLAGAELSSELMRELVTGVATGPFRLPYCLAEVVEEGAEASMEQVAAALREGDMGIVESGNWWFRDDSLFGIVERTVNDYPEECCYEAQVAFDVCVGGMGSSKRYRRVMTTLEWCYCEDADGTKNYDGERKEWDWADELAREE